MHPLIQTLRRRASGVIAHHTLNTLSRLGRLDPRARRALREVEITRDVRYGPLPIHALDVYRPSGHAGPLPTVLYIHGGGFRLLSKDSHWPMALRFAQQGFAVFNINYRLGRFPAGLIDVTHAWRWLHGAAGAWGARGPFIVAGESAGANLALVLTLMTCARRPEPFARALLEAPTPDLLLPACGILQVSDVARLKRHDPSLPRWLEDRIAQVSWGYLGRAPRDAALADPLLILESGAPLERPLPPIFAGVGARDPLLDDTQRLGAALARRGAPHEVAVYADRGHAFQAFIWDEAARRFWADQLRFIRAHLQL